MTSDEAARIIRSIEDRAIEHTILLTKITKAAYLTAAAAVVIALVVILR